ncbi:MAG: molybdopterin-dependent oxidoreductase [Rhodospirillum sp.]|nr:molybdopterin-dependent oxidoreductase [Rhodospirillum sp.]MCF8490892.1 molybdopterin-dependent oxidoreductase [Rhodospirillum sp.]MCF8499930.1 molybdopterin-dependent oxidoreductase [Rhodospirillum sp.]
MTDHLHIPLSRRAVLKGVTALTASAILAPGLFQGARASTLAAAVSANHFGLCLPKVENGRLVATPSHPVDPAPTEMITALSDVVNAPSRIRHPMVRRSFLEKGVDSDRSDRGKGDFVQVTWDEALDLVAKELTRVKDTHGCKAIYGGSYGWKSTGLFHNCANGLYRMLNLNGGFVDDVNTYSTGSIRVILPYVIGGSFYASSSWEAHLKGTEQIVFWGSDPMVSCRIGSNAPNHSTFDYMRQYKESGRPAIVVDPIRTHTADYLNAQWIAPRPGTDVAMMLGIAHTLLMENLHDTAFLADYTTGFEAFAAYLTGEEDGTAKTADWASAICGVAPEAIKDLARSMASKRTLITMGWSIQRQDHGEQGPWMAFTLGCMLGTVGLPGGGADFTLHYANYGVPKAHAPVFAGLPAGDAPEGLPPPIPVSRVPWCLANPGAEYEYDGKTFTAPDLRLVYWAGGNPMHHHQDRNLHIQFWHHPETIIVQDIFWTQTARFADIVLPATTSFERNDMTAITEAGNGLAAMRKVIEPLYEARSDFDIYRAISARLGFEDAFTEGRDEMAWLRHIYEKGMADAEKKEIAIPDFDTFWNETQVLTFEPTEKTRNYVQFADFREDPLLNPVATPSGKFEILSRRIAGYNLDDCPGHPTWMEPIERLGGAESDKHPFHIVTHHPYYRLHSQLNNSESLRALYEVQGREPIWIHPEDAAERGIADGDVVRVFNGRGQVLAGAVITDAVSRHVAQLCEGAWYDPAEPGVPGTLCKHGDVNVLTPDKGTSKLAQGNIGHTVLAEIEKFEGPLPAITTFSEPTAA